MRKKEVIEVETKREWNFIAKFYFVCIIIFVLFVAYIVIYRYTHWDEVQNNIKNNNQNVINKGTEETIGILVGTEIATSEEKVINSEEIIKTESPIDTKNTKEQTYSQSNNKKQIQSNISIPSTSTQSTKVQTPSETITEPTEESKPVESFRVNNNLINKMKNIINSNPSTSMNQFGYNIVVDSSIVNQTTGFTYTENRVKNAIVYKFGTIRIYARDYYVGNELRWTESFIL